MKDKFVKWHKKIKDWLTQILFKRYLTPFVLVFIYIFIVGLTSFLSKIFFKKALSKSPSATKTNWIEVEDYEGNLDESLKQS